MAHVCYRDRSRFALCAFVQKTLDSAFALLVDRNQPGFRCLILFCPQQGSPGKQLVRISPSCSRDGKAVKTQQNRQKTLGARRREEATKCSAAAFHNKCRFRGLLVRQSAFVSRREPRSSPQVAIYS